MIINMILHRFMMKNIDLFKLDLKYAIYLSGNVRMVVHL